MAEQTLAAIAGLEGKDFEGNDPWRFVFEIDLSKADTGEEGIVEGWATVAKPDLQNDLIPMSVAVAAFEKAASTVAIREMHQPKAIGTLIAWWPDEANQRIGVRIQLSQSQDGRDAWLKVKEHVLKGLSIAGRAFKWAYQGGVRVIKELMLTEISLVDSPANPLALITVMKYDYAGEVEPPVQVASPASVVNPAASASAQPVDPSDPSVIQHNVDGIRDLAHMLAKAVAPDFVDKLVEEVIQKVDAKAKEKVIAELTARGKKVGIARRDGEPLTPPKGFPTNPAKYGDPANWSWPVDTPGRATSALSYYNGGRGKEKYSDREWAILGRRIARLAGEIFDAPYRFDPKEKKVSRQEIQKTIGGPDMSQTLAVLKGNLGQMAEALKAQIASAAKALGDGDSAGASAMLAQAGSAADVMRDGVRSIEGPAESAMGSEPSLPTSYATKAAGPTVGSAPIAQATPPVSIASTPAPAQMAHPVTAPSSPSSSDVEKAFEPFLAKMDALLKALTPEPKPSTTPVVTKGNVVNVQPADNGGVVNEAASPFSPLQKALIDGDWAKATELVTKDGITDANKLYVESERITRASMVQKGITMQRLGVPGMANGMLPSSVMTQLQQLGNEIAELKKARGIS